MCLVGFQQACQEWIPLATQLSQCCTHHTGSWPCLEGYNRTLHERITINLGFGPLKFLQNLQKIYVGKEIRLCLIKSSSSVVLTFVLVYKIMTSTKKMLWQQDPHCCVGQSHLPSLLKSRWFTTGTGIINMSKWLSGPDTSAWDYAWLME